MMQARYHDIAENMESKPGLPAACVAAETDWRQCIFSQHAFKYSTTPTFVINSLYNFGAWALLATNASDGSGPPRDWEKCWPATGQMTPDTYKNCNATQIKIVQGFRESFIQAG